MSDPTDCHAEGHGRAPLQSGRHDRVDRAPSTARPLLARDIFTRLVLVERRRSERSGRPFGLLVLRASGSVDPSMLRAGQAVRDALLSATRGTDVAGWIAPRSVLGILLPDLAESEPWATLERVRARVERALRGHLGTGHAVRVVGRLFPEPAPVEAARLALNGSIADELGASLESLLYPELGKAGVARRGAETLKRGLDLAASLALLVALAPLGLVIAGLVRLSSSGPILFRQVRIGYGGRPFTMLKFRTMYTGVDETVHREFISRFIADGQHAVSANGANGGAVFKLTNDKRVTPIGHLLRRTSLDELPQLWNVLRGEMSLVGPRPPLPYELEQYAPWHRRRVLEARPGITGTWQVGGRSRTTFDEMVRLDLRYARTRSLWIDLRILLATPWAAISGKGAR
jgi:lipopolysaccharide/colanic/teichoic acid biosynthesis glycosyltransferase